MIECNNCGRIYPKEQIECCCMSGFDSEFSSNEIDNSCNFKHCKHFGKNPIYEPCSLCNLRRDLRNCYQEEE